MKYAMHRLSSPPLPDYSTGQRLGGGCASLHNTSNVSPRQVLSGRHHAGPTTLTLDHFLIRRQYHPLIHNHEAIT